MKVHTLAASIAGLVLSAGAANAFTIMQTQPFGPSTPNYGATVTFNQYNLNPADLVSIKVKLVLDVSGGQLVVDNDGVGPASVNVLLGAAGAISSMDVPLIDLLLQPFSGNAVAATGNMFNLGPENGDGVGNIDSTGPDGAIHMGGVDSDMQMAFIHPAAWPGYIGAGTFDINVLVSQILDFGGIGGVEGGFSPVTASGNVMVEYEYVPTPGSAALLGLGGLVALRRRR